MQLDITGHHVEMTDALRAHVVSKVSKINDHFDQISKIHCILTVEKFGHKAEATAQVMGKQIYADAIDDNMYAAIDKLSHKLNRIVRKRKEKIQDHHT